LSSNAAAGAPSAISDAAPRSASTAAASFAAVDRVLSTFATLAAFAAVAASFANVVLLSLIMIKWSTIALKASLWPFCISTGVRFPFGHDNSK
jgi:hypothetical protein